MNPASEPSVAETEPLEKALEPMADPAITKIVIAIHGIGDQYRNATVRSVVNIFGRYFDQPIPAALGGFYSADGTIQVFPPKAPPNLTAPMRNIGFIEAYWADVPRRVQHRGYTIEETKAWARTVVQRVQAQYEARLNETLGLSRADYLSTIAALEQMIDAIGVLGNLFFLAEKAGFTKFELEDMLTAYVGDVQIVADFANYRRRIRRQVWKILEEVHHKNNKAELYIVSHSEGTVVALVTLLSALSQSDPEGTAEHPPKWIRRVRGLMTLGSPIDKHLILWPTMWDDLKDPYPSFDLECPIRWRNYYDYADPVGFELETARTWLECRGWKRFFEFTDRDDYGFARYFLPGKAHNDYWNDPLVFGHFIRDVVVRPPDIDGKKTEGPPSRRLARLSSYFTPYLLIVLLLGFAVCILYTGVNTYLSLNEPWGTTACHALALASLLAGTTVASRILCLTRRPAWKWGAMGIFAAFAAGYAALIGGVKLPDPPNPDHAIAGVGMILMTILAASFAIVLSLLCDRNKAFLQKWPPLRLFAKGLRPLLIAGGLATTMLVGQRIGAHPTAPAKSAWPLLLSGALFFYLWWLAAILFDLIFTWQRYIRGAVWQKHLAPVCAERIRGDSGAASPVSSCNRTAAATR